MTHSIDEVIARLEGIVDRSRDDNSRAGYFAAMYCSVTKAVKQAIGDGKFEDGPRMTELDVVFANRYLEAFDRHQSGRRATSAWEASFAGAARWRPIIVQQLLTGMNAHINLDLGIAAATVAPGDALAGLHADFNMINQVLAAMTDRFVDDVASVSPWIRSLDRIGGRTEQALIKFSVDVARDEAWKLAQQLAPLPQQEWPPVIAKRDDWTAGFGRHILRPGFWLPIGLMMIRLRESNDVTRVIDLLAAP
jgi:hypothetical protein